MRLTAEQRDADLQCNLHLSCGVKGSWHGGRQCKVLLRCCTTSAWAAARLTAVHRAAEQSATCCTANINGLGERGASSNILLEWEATCAWSNSGATSKVRENCRATSELLQGNMSDSDRAVCHRTAYEHRRSNFKLRLVKLQTPTWPQAANKRGGSRIIRRALLLLLLLLGAVACLMAAPGGRMGNHAVRRPPT